LLTLAVAVALAACGGGGSPSTATSAPPSRPAVAGSPASDWPLFGFDAQRSNVSTAPTGIRATDVGHLRHQRVSVPGTVDSSPIYLSGVSVRGALHDVLIMTTGYGKTLAVDAHSGSILWTFVPPGTGSLEGSEQITTSAPAADPSRQFVYAVSPDGRVHKLAAGDGHEASGWPVTITRNAGREKIGTALNVAGPDVLATTGGYYGDAPTYQGHVVAIARSNGAIRHVFNSLCADRHSVITPSSCGASGSAIWARAGAVVEPSGRVLVATGNGPYNGRTNFGQSVIELSPTLSLRQAFTPSNEAPLSARDTDVGSSAPALLPGELALQGTKEGVMRLLDLRRLDGSPPGHGFRLGGALQTLPTPGGAELFSQPTVWRHGSRTTVFVATASGTAAYILHGRRLSRSWSNGTAGTSPVLAGGLLWVYDPNGGLDVYLPGTGRRLAALPAGSGHWGSPIVAGGVVAVTEGDAKDHNTTGVLDLYRR
jgi:hypothetical protein